MADEMMEYVELETIDIPLEDGTELTCAVIDEFEIDDQGYIVLAPVNEDDTIDESEVYYYRCDEDGDEVVLTAIDDEEEMAWAIAAHLEIFEDDEDEEEDEE